MRTARCSSPRPATRNWSVESVSSARMETLVSSSLYSRSRRWREVTYLPSRPAKGLVLTEKVIWTVLVDSYGWHGVRLLGIGQGLADHDLREAGDGHDFARLDLVHLFTFQSFE